MNLWVLPCKAVLGGKEFDIRSSWRDAMTILTILDGDGPEWARW